MFEQIGRIHNCLATSSSHALSKAPPITQVSKSSVVPNLSLFHKMWTSVLVVARNPDDIQALAKTESRKLQAVYFGLDVRRGGNFVYLTEQKRLTTVKFDDCHYEPDIYPELPKFITGIQLVGDITFRLPTLSEQDAVAEQDARDRDVGSPLG